MGRKGKMSKMLRSMLICCLLASALAASTGRKGKLIETESSVIDQGDDYDGDDDYDGIDDYDDDKEDRAVHNLTIVGGDEAEENAYPFVISLRAKYGNQYDHICGGSIYKANYIITAAHCVEEYGDYQIVAGEHDFNAVSGNEQTIKVKRVIKNRRYDDDSFQNDIAVLELEESLTLNDYVQPIALSKGKPKNKNKVIGWGTTSSGGSSSDVLLEVEVNVFSTSYCRRKYRSAFDSKTMFCAGSYIGGKDSCQGDSGGPIFTTATTPQLTGVVSWGYGCADKKYPGVYTLIRKYRSWVIKQIK